MIEIIHNRDHYKRFIRFLKEHSAFAGYFYEMRRNNYEKSSFVRRYEKNFNKFFNQCSPSSWLDCCFNWQKTKLGEDYWNDLYRKWIYEYEIQWK